jgi:hypothetical protein
LAYPYADSSAHKNLSQLFWREVSFAPKRNSGPSQK